MLALFHCVNPCTCNSASNCENLPRPYVWVMDIEDAEEKRGWMDGMMVVYFSSSPVALEEGCDV